MHEHDRPTHHRDPLDTLPDDLARRARDELTQHENLLWAGQPRPDLYASGSLPALFIGLFCLLLAAGLLLIPLGIGLLIFLGGLTSKDPAGGAFAGGMCSLPFLCVAVVMGLPFSLMGLFLVTVRRRQRGYARRSCYVLTNRRAITFVAGGWGAMLVRSFQPEQLEELFRVELADGSGSLIFQEALVRTSGGRHHSRGVSTRRYGFLCINDVARVEDLIRANLLRAN